jgi:hypothetical protein
MSCSGYTTTVKGDMEINGTMNISGNTNLSNVIIGCVLTISGTTTLNNA